jgi:hypothetical protein
MGERNTASVHPEMASFAPILRSPQVSILDVALLSHKPFSSLRDHFRDVSFVQLNHARSASVQALRRNRSAITRAYGPQTAHDS